MKIHSVFAIATALILAATIAAPSAAAQGVRANIPFEFQAAGKVFPAGTYTLTPVNSGALRLTDSRGRGVFLPADRESTKPEERNWIVFHQYGKQTFLAGAYWAGASLSMRVPESKAEQEVAKVAGRVNPVRLAVK